MSTIGIVFKMRGLSSGDFHHNHADWTFQSETTDKSRRRFANVEKLMRSPVFSLPLARRPHTGDAFDVRWTHAF